VHVIAVEANSSVQRLYEDLAQEGGHTFEGVMPTQESGLFDPDFLVVRLTRLISEAQPSRVLLLVGGTWTPSGHKAAAANRSEGMDCCVLVATALHHPAPVGEDLKVVVASVFPPPIESFAASWLHPNEVLVKDGAGLHRLFELLK